MSDTDRYVADQVRGRHVVLDRSWLSPRVVATHPTAADAQADADRRNTPPRPPQRSQQTALFDTQEATA